MTDVMIDTIRTIDDVFIQMAEAGIVEGASTTAIGRELTIDEAVEEMWTTLELGNLRLVVDGVRLRVEPFERPEAERLLLAERQWPLIAARRRVLCGLYEPQGARVHG
jgi:hypothetical protein